MDVNRIIDINCDLGEGMPNDALLMPYISSCNIACGGHYGSKDSIRTAIQLAKQYGVKVGAHPSYPDRENFGRKSMEISSSNLTDNIREQISDFLSVCKEERVQPNHIKLHGALYSDSAHNEIIVDAFLNAYNDLNLAVPIYTAPGSIITKKTDKTLLEAFIDRRYNADGTLVSRNQSNALIEDSKDAWNQLKRMCLNREVLSIDGQTIPMSAMTYCVHGDTPNAIEIARYIDTRLKTLNIRLDKHA